jgi:hypothetical protein
VLTEQLDVLLSVGTRLINSLAAFASSLGQLLALVLDLSVKTFENWQNCTLQLF